MDARLRLLGKPAAESEITSARSRPPWLPFLALIVAVVALVGLIAWCDNSESRSVRDLPATQRKALYQRTMANLQSVCTAPAEGMRTFCVEQARLALAMPECGAACQALASKQIASVPQR